METSQLCYVRPPSSTHVNHSRANACAYSSDDARTQTPQSAHTCLIALGWLALDITVHRDKHACYSCVRMWALSGAHNATGAMYDCKSRISIMINKRMQYVCSMSGYTTRRSFSAVLVCGICAVSVGMMCAHSPTWMRTNNSNDLHLQHPATHTYRHAKRWNVRSPV